LATSTITKTCREVIYKREKIMNSGVLLTYIWRRFIII